VDSDVDAFWDEALNAGEGNPGASGLSFEEARKQGLVSMEEKDEE
jgi:hypothetical protein